MTKGPRARGAAPYCIGLPRTLSPRTRSILLRFEMCPGKLRLLLLSLLCFLLLLFGCPLGGIGHGSRGGAAHGAIWGGGQGRGSIWGHAARAYAGPETQTCSEAASGLTD